MYLFKVSTPFEGEIRTMEIWICRRCYRGDIV